MNLFVYSHPQEYITRSILKWVGSRPNWRAVDMDLFVREAQVREWLGQAKIERKWTIQAEEFDLSCGVRIFDRVFSLENQEKHFSDPRFALLEMDAFFYYLRQQKNYINTLLHHGPRTWKIPLITQWNLVSRMGIRLQVPQYEYPYDPLNSSLNRERLVVTDFSETNMWRIGVHSQKDRVMAFERPEGEVYAVLASPSSFMGSQQEALPPELGRLAMDIACELKTYFLEMVFFKKEDEVTFGMLSAQPSNLFSSATLETFLQTELKKLELSL